MPDEQNGSSNDLPDGYDPELAARIKSKLLSAPPVSLPDSISTDSQIRLVSDEIRAGGLGCVGRYWDEELDREVAVKFIKPNMDEAFQQRFHREITITSSLDHPGVVPIYNIGHCDGQPYYTMRFVSGVTFAEAVEQFHSGPENKIRRDNPRFRNLLESFKSACATIGYAHQEKSVWHRDVKPQNIMIESGLTVVLDWGLAKQVARNNGDLLDDRFQSPGQPSDNFRQGIDQDVTRADQYLGSPAYMAPEQGRGQIELIDNLTDVYGLGATLFELLTGQAPHHQSQAMAETVTMAQALSTRTEKQSSSEADQLHRLLQQIATQPTPSAKAVNPAVPGELDSICRRAMAFSKPDRYQSPLEIQEDLECWLTQSQVAAHRYSYREHFLGWIRKHSGITAVALVATLLLAAISILSYWLVADAKMRTDTALQEIRNERSARIDDLLAIYISATPVQAEVILNELESYSAVELERGIRAADIPANSIQQSRRLQLIHLDDHPETLTELVDPQSELSAGELSLVRSAIHAPGLYQDERILNWLWETSDSPENCLPTAAILARLVPDDPRWQSTAPTVAARLLRTGNQQTKAWADLYRDVRRWLKQPLMIRYQGDPRAVGSDKGTSALLLLEFFKDDPDVLVSLIGNADKAMLDAILNYLKPITASAKNTINQVIATPRPAKSFVGEHWLSEIVAESNGMITDAFAICDAMPDSVFDRFASRLRSMGYRPQQVQPYQLAGKPVVASTWVRDDRPFQISWQLPGSKIQELIRSNRTLGWIPCSLSAELIDEEIRYTMVFCQDHTDVGVYQVLLDNSLADHKPLSRELGLKGFQQRNYIEILDGNSELMIAGLYRHDPSQFDQASVAALLEDTDDPDLLRLVDLVPISLQRGPRGLTGIWIDNSTVKGVIVANSDRSDRIEAWKSLANNGFLPIEVSIANNSSQSRPEPFSIWHRSARSASSLANYAMALCRLGDDGLIVQSLMRAPDSTLRTLLIHRFQTDGVDPARLVNWLQVSADPGIRAAIIQALGHFSEVDFEAAEFNRAIELIRNAHLEDSDAGVHSSAQWALTQWHVEPDSISPDSAPSEFKNWYVDASGQTMSVVRGPTTFNMGSRIRPRMSSAPENQHLRSIDRDFAIGIHEVTWEQYAEFMPELPPGFTRHYGKLENGRPNPHAPQYQVSWYRAAEYCNWLSQRAGLPKSEWCYLPAEDGRYGPGMQVADNFLERSGYRLPTEAEWEYAARAGSTTPRFFGLTSEMLTAYGWHKANSNITTHTVGSLKPNELGLFDVYGNVWEWCHGSRDDNWPEYFEHADDNKLNTLPLNNQHPRILRGGSIVNPAGLLRSSMRSFNKPSNEQFTIGFRVARTLTGNAEK